MGKSLSAQQGGDLTERLALRFWAYHRAPHLPRQLWGVGEELVLYPQWVPRENSGYRLGS